MSTTAADGEPRGVAGRSQTVDVYGSPRPVASGGFRLSYGNDDGISRGSSSSSTGSGSTSTSTSSTITTSCISANSTLLTADTVAAALSSTNGFLNVTVTEDDPPFDDARRFAVKFGTPEVGVGTVGVVDADEDCGWLQCEDTEGDGVGDCDETGVIINRDASVAVQEGAVEVWLDTVWFPWTLFRAFFDYMHRLGSFSSMACFCTNLVVGVVLWWSMLVYAVCL